MPQISKDLLSDAMYCVHEYRRKVREERQLLIETGLPEHSELSGKLQAEYDYTENVLNQLRALYEVSDSSFGGPRPPIITGGEDVLK